VPTCKLKQRARQRAWWCAHKDDPELWANRRAYRKRPDVMAKARARSFSGDAFLRSLFSENQHPTRVTAKSLPATCAAPTSVTFPSASAGESAGEPITVYLPVGDVADPVDRVNVASSEKSL
jgi:hypothetical protein